MAGQQQGTIVNWNDDRGFGFIRPDAGGKELFFHISDVNNGQARPRENLKVTYSASRDEKGRACAIDVTFHGIVLSADDWPPAVALLFLIGVAGLGLAGVLPMWVLAVYVVFSAVTLLVYRSDKARAENGTWRTPEKVLHMLELAGGWPGALIAQWRYRHKTRKVSYQISFWLIVVVNLVLLALLATGNL